MTRHDFLLSTRSAKPQESFRKINQNKKGLRNIAVGGAPALFYQVETLLFALSNFAGCRPRESDIVPTTNDWK
jgi:hypothetical protein